MIKKLFSLFVTVLFISLIAISSAQAFIDVTAPDITSDVHVVKNATPEQCPASWRGSADPETNTIVSGAGMNNVGTVGTQSCVSCAIDKASGDCVCARCYGYFN